MLSGLFQAASLLRGEEPSRAGPFDLVLATVIAGAVGYAAIAFLLRFLVRRSTLIFVVYRVTLGAVVLALAGSGTID